MATGPKARDDVERAVLRAVTEGVSGVQSEASTIELLERELARAYRIERALRDVGLALGTTLDLDALLRLVLERTTEALEAERATLYLLEHRRGQGEQHRFETMLVSRVMEGGDAAEIVLRLGEGIAGEVARTGRAANVKDAYGDPRFSRHQDEKTGFRTRSVLCVPLKSQLGRIIGVIQVLNKRPGGTFNDAGAWSGGVEDASFDDDDEALLAALAAQAAVSIEQARLFQSILEKNRELSSARGQLEKKVQDLNVLFAIERATARASNRDELALAILPEAARALGGRTAYVVLADDASGDLSLLHIGTDAAEVAPDSLAPPSRGARHSMAPNSGAYASGLRRLRVKAGDGLVGKAIQTGQVVVSRDVGADTRTSPRISSTLFANGEDMGAPCAVVPLLDDTERAFGALAVVRRRGDRAFNDDDVDLLRLVALNASTGFQLQTAREESAREARLSTIGSLMSGMLHDLKTPMAVISGYVQMMASTDDPNARAEQAEIVLRQFEHVAAMQKEVLDFARGERRVLVRRVYLTKFFAEIEAQLRHEIARRKARVELTVDLRDRGVARFDESKLTRAMHNLARNALEAMEPTTDDQHPGKLAITVDRADDNALVIVVSDTGPGILPEVQARLFESFVTAGKPKGTGLGLAIVKKIAEDHGGTIEASSSASGARFTLRLPQPQDALKKTPTPFPVR